MANIARSLWQASRSLIASATSCSSLKTCLPASSTCHRCYCSDFKYDPYPEFNTPSPFKKQEKYRYGYKTHQHAGGVLPRPDGDLADQPLPIPMWRAHEKDQWVQKKALFGQNDYIDILGDGTLHPFQLTKGPAWLRAFKGNELQRLVRLRRFRGSYLREFYPTKYHDLTKRIFFLYKRLNKRKAAPYWGSRHASSRSRIERIRD